jgi:DNA-binding FrmR family transcriptional regulator
MADVVLAEHADELRKRLHRMEGQVRGVSKMLEEERSCPEIIQQLTAIRAAAHQASLLVIRAYAHECLVRSDAGKPPGVAIDDLIKVLSKTI